MEIVESPLKLKHLKLISNILTSPTHAERITKENIYTILNSTSFSDGVLGAREYAVLAVKNLCVIEKNRDIVEELRAQAGVENGVMRKAGLEVSVEDGKVKVNKK